MGHDEHAHKGSSIKWGLLIAGAAVAAGAILFAPSLIGDGLPTTLGNIGKTIGERIMAFFAASPEPLTDAARIAAENSRKLVMQVAGAGLIGGGLAYLLGHKDAPQVHHRESDESFAMKEDMRKMQAMMVVRAAAAGHPQAQAMLAQQHGLGA